jgi:hypothetical protein
MDKRIRSPNYPALSLPDALDKVLAFYRNLHGHSAPREVAVKAMGYNSLNGASATAISALHKYGLLERVGDEVKVSERALRILHPHSPEERVQAIREAGAEPALFAKLAERFPGRFPNEELLRNYLVREGFAPSAVSHVILAYRDTSELVEREVGGHDSGPETAPEALMQGAGGLRVDATIIKKPPAIQGDARQIVRYDFEGGGYVQLLVGGSIDTEAALNMTETLLKLKRAELQAKPKTSSPQTSPDVPDEDSNA